MTFHESATFPALGAYGGLGGPEFTTSLQTGPSGYEARDSLWSVERGSWELGFQNRSAAETEAVLAFFYCVARGRLDGFRFADFGAHEATGDGEPLGTGDGSTVTFQLVKRYTSGTLTYDRPIVKPVPGSVQVWSNGVLVSPSAYTVDSTAGVLTWSVAPVLGAVLTASFAFHVAVRLDTDSLQVRGVAPDTCSWESVRLVALRDAEAISETAP